MAEPNSFEWLILAFERAWQQSVSPDIGEFARRCDDKTQLRSLLIELICVDLEYRWRAAALNPGQATWTLADYIDKFKDVPSLCELPQELIEEEYRVRRRWGDKTSLTEFAERYRESHSNLRRQLERIDLELSREAGDDRTLSGRVDRTRQPAPRPAAVPDSLAPLSYGDYLLQEMIGAGRFGRVYRAWQRSLSRPVALKYLRKSFQQNPEAVDRFIGEAITVSQLQHSGIVAIHGVGKTPGGGYFIAMDLVDGCDLSRMIDRNKVSVADAVRWLIDACEALRHAHEHGIIHCDLKPANLLLSEDGDVRVTDFGLARFIREEARPVDRIEGTCGFMAPEQVCGWWGPMSPRTDVYGIGAVLFNLVTGETPYRGSTLADVLAQVVSGAPARAPNDLRAELPASVNDVCMRCLAKSPDARYETMRQLGAALRELLAAVR